MTHRILVVFGTRPEAIKMAPVIAELAARPQVFEPVVCVTAQHREMLDEVLALFEITPDFDLDVMLARQSLAHITVKALEGVSSVLERTKPQAMLIQGDTTTTFSAALAAFYQGVSVGHVEAGLRTHDMRQPFPEEANRRLASVLTRWHFAPTERAAANLLAEGHDPRSIHVTGNTVVDALHSILDRPFEFPGGPVASAIASGRRILLVTAHRRENWGAPMQRICAAVREVVEQIPDVHVFFATHRNPAVLETVRSGLGGTERVDLLDPLDYLTFVRLMSAAHLILSDSGGVQEEGPALGRPVLVMREKTERPEAVEAGVARLVGTDTANIVSEVTRLLTDGDAYDAMARAVSPFGDGHAAERICDILQAELDHAAAAGAHE
ncbi:MAG TPA: UDP-N-acetylglucosamine 2-epimerase (non-hydrolyzing) [Coriobacteriia bacterium]